MKHFGFALLFLTGCQSIGVDYVYGYDEFLNDVPVGASGWVVIADTAINVDAMCNGLGESCCSGAMTEDHVLRVCNLEDGLAVKIDDWEWR